MKNILENQLQKGVLIDTWWNVNYESNNQNLFCNMF